MVVMRGMELKRTRPKHYWVTDIKFERIKASQLNTQLSHFSDIFSIHQGSFACLFATKRVGSRVGKSEEQTKSKTEQQMQIIRLPLPRLWRHTCAQSLSFVKASSLLLAALRNQSLTGWSSRLLAPLPPTRTIPSGQTLDMGRCWPSRHDCRKEAKDWFSFTPQWGFHVTAARLARL